MIGYCKVGQGYIDWPCSTSGCPQYESCLAQYKDLLKNKDYVPNTKKCGDCVFWRSGGGNSDVKFNGVCHHLLDTGKRRKRDKRGNCLSYRKRCE